MNRLTKIAATGFSPVTVATSPAPSVPISGAGDTLSRCPDCDGLFSDRIRDEDTGCFYPVDDGEHYCDGCDSIWSIDQDPTWVEFAAPFKRLADGFLRVEL